MDQEDFCGGMLLLKKALPHSLETKLEKKVSI